MKSFPLNSVALMAVSLTACGNAQDNAATTSAPEKAPMEMADEGIAMDHSSHDMSGQGGDSHTGHATGVIRSIGSQGNFLTIEHGPIEGVGMDAMTMGFDILGNVDLSGFSDGDKVAFMVKQSRDGSYRIMAICNTGTDGADCLDGMMNK